MKNQQSLWDFLKEDVFDTKNQTLMMAWVSGVVGTIFLGFYLTTETVGFIGIAESRDSFVNFERSVEVKAIHVLPGQKVKAGDLLAEVSQVEIISRQMEVSSLLQKLEAERNVRSELAAVFKNSRDNPFFSDPLSVEINSLKKELLYLDQQKRNLFIFAEVDGVVGSVNFKRGEKVAPFLPIVTVAPENPTLIHGYVHENLHTTLQVGQKLYVFSTTGSAETKGVIVSIASKITLIPERLSRVAGLASWGREVTLEIPKINKFLHGEKVKIQPKLANWGILQAMAGKLELNPNIPEYQVHDITRPAMLVDEFKFEPSGLIYLSDLKKYLVISDDDQHLMMMDSEGRISDQLFPILAAEEIGDLESISTDARFIYLLSSQSAKKNGSHEKKRELFLKVSREGFDFKLKESIYLRPLLLKAMTDSKDEELRGLAKKIFDRSDDLEIEAHAVQNDRLYLALKRPTSGNEIIFLQIKGFSRLFSEKKLLPEDLSLWMKLRIPAAMVKIEHNISDMSIHESKLYFSTTCKAHDCSALWKYDLQSKNTEPVLLKSISNGRLEGIFYTADTNTLMGVFDQHGKNAQFLKVSFLEKENR